MTKKKLEMNKGFTLTETIIYVALFALIITGTLSSVYGILEANVRNQNKVMVQEEGAFILGKIDWALTGISSVGVDLAGKILTVTKSNPSFNPLVISIDDDGNVFIERAGGGSKRLNNSNISVSCAPAGCFERTLASGDGINPESISADIIVNSRSSDGTPYSQHFSTIKYLRK